MLSVHYNHVDFARFISKPIDLWILLNEVVIRKSKPHEDHNKTIRRTHVSTDGACFSVPNAAKERQLLLEIAKERDLQYSAPFLNHLPTYLLETMNKDEPIHPAVDIDVHITDDIRSQALKFEEDSKDDHRFKRGLPSFAWAKVRKLNSDACRDPTDKELQLLLFALEKLVFPSAATLAEILSICFCKEVKVFVAMPNEFNTKKFSWHLHVPELAVSISDMSKLSKYFAHAMQTLVDESVDWTQAVDDIYSHTLSLRLIGNYKAHSCSSCSTKTKPSSKRNEYLQCDEIVQYLKTNSTNQILNDGLCTLCAGNGFISEKSYYVPAFSVASMAIPSSSSHSSTLISASSISSTRIPLQSLELPFALEVKKNQCKLPTSLKGFISKYTVDAFQKSENLFQTQIFNYSIHVLEDIFYSSSTSSFSSSPPSSLSSSNSPGTSPVSCSSSSPTFNKLLNTPSNVSNVIHEFDTPFVPKRYQTRRPPLPGSHGSQCTWFRTNNQMCDMKCLESIQRSEIRLKAQISGVTAKQHPKFGDQRIVQGTHHPWNRLLHKAIESSVCLNNKSFNTSCWSTIQVARSTISVSGQTTNHIIIFPSGIGSNLCPHDGIEKPDNVVHIRINLRDSSKKISRNQYVQGNGFEVFCSSCKLAGGVPFAFEANTAFRSLQLASRIIAFPEEHNVESTLCFLKDVQKTQHIRLQSSQSFESSAHSEISQLINSNIDYSVTSQDSQSRLDYCEMPHTSLTQALSSAFQDSLSNQYSQNSENNNNNPNEDNDDDEDTQDFKRSRVNSSPNHIPLPSSFCALPSLAPPPLPDFFAIGKAVSASGGAQASMQHLEILSKVQQTNKQK